MGRLAGIATSFVAEDLSIRIAMGIYGISGFISMLCCIALPFDTTGKDLKDDVQGGVMGHIELQEVRDEENG